MTQACVLVVEDDRAIRAGLVDALTSVGYRVLQEERGDTGRDAAIKADIDLLVLDMVLPGLDGLEVLEAVRQARPTLPVIVLTARGSEDDRVRGLGLGADDYMVKPFSIRELLARIQAVLRRSAERPLDIAALAFHGGTADLERRELRHDDGERLQLSELETDLLRYLAGRPGRAVSRDELLERVWRVSAAGGETRTVDVLVGRLRQKLRDNPAAPRIIRTVRGKGYSFQEDAAEPGSPPAGDAP